MREILAPGATTTRSSPASASATSSGPATAATASSAASSSHPSPFLGTLVDQQILLKCFYFSLISWSEVWRDPHQWQSFREDEVSDVVSPDGELVQLDWIAVLQGHLDMFQVGVHSHVNTRDGSVHLRNSYFVRQLNF